MIQNFKNIKKNIRRFLFTLSEVNSERVIMSQDGPPTGL